MDLPADSFMYSFIDDGHLFYVIQEDEHPLGMCVDISDGIGEAKKVFDTSEYTEMTDLRMISGSKYFLKTYTQKDKEATLINLTDGSEIDISGFEFSDSTVVTFNSSMTHILFSNFNYDADTSPFYSQIAVLDIESGRFEMLERESGSGLNEWDIFFAKDNKVAIISNSPTDAEYIYISLYTFSEFSKNGTEQDTTDNAPSDVQG